MHKLALSLVTWFLLVSPSLASDPEPDLKTRVSLNDLPIMKDIHELLGPIPTEGDLQVAVQKFSLIFVKTLDAQVAVNRGLANALFEDRGLQPTDFGPISYDFLICREVPLVKKKKKASEQVNVERPTRQDLCDNLATYITDWDMLKRMHYFQREQATDIIYYQLLQTILPSLRMPKTLLIPTSLTEAAIQTAHQQSYLRYIQAYQGIIKAHFRLHQLYYPDEERDAPAGYLKTEQYGIVNHGLNGEQDDSTLYHNYLYICTHAFSTATSVDTPAFINPNLERRLYLFAPNSNLGSFMISCAAFEIYRKEQEAKVYGFVVGAQNELALLSQTYSELSREYAQLVTIGDQLRERTQAASLRLGAITTAEAGVKAAQANLDGTEAKLALAKKELAIWQGKVVNLKQTVLSKGESELQTVDLSRLDRQLKDLHQQIKQQAGVNEQLQLSKAAVLEKAALHEETMAREERQAQDRHHQATERLVDFQDKLVTVESSLQSLTTELTHQEFKLKELTQDAELQHASRMKEKSERLARLRQQLAIAKKTAEEAENHKKQRSSCTQALKTRAKELTEAFDARSKELSQQAILCEQTKTSVADKHSQALALQQATLKANEQAASDALRVQEAASRTIVQEQANGNLLHDPIQHLKGEFTLPLGDGTMVKMTLTQIRDMGFELIKAKQALGKVEGNN